MLVCVIIATQSKIENEMENMSQDLTLIHGIGTYLTFGTGFQLQLLLLLYITCPPMFVMCTQSLVESLQAENRPRPFPALQPRFCSVARRGTSQLMEINKQAVTPCEKYGKL